MKKESKQKVSHVEFIRGKMILRDWKAADLARSSGVSTGVLSRYFNDDGISADNLFAIMGALNLLENSDNNFMCGWPEDAIEYCQKLKKVLENKDDSEIVKKMIDAYTDKYKIKKTRKKGLLKPTGT